MRSMRSIREENGDLLRLKRNLKAKQSVTAKASAAERGRAGSGGTRGGGGGTIDRQTLEEVKTLGNLLSLPRFMLLKGQRRFRA